MENYFGYDVVLCMNITDIEDKIIIRLVHESEATHIALWSGH